MGDTEPDIEAAETRPVRRLSSSLTKSPTKNRSPHQLIHSFHMASEKRGAEEEVVPDSEEERSRATRDFSGSEELTRTNYVVPKKVNVIGIIEISSDEDELFYPAPKNKYHSSNDPFLASKKTGARPDENASRTTSGSGKPKPAITGTQLSRCTIISSSESEANSDPDADAPQVTVDMSDESPKHCPMPTAIPKPGLPPDHVRRDPPTYASLWADESDNDDGAILTLDEPRSARKPLQKPNSSTSQLTGAGPSHVLPSAPSSGETQIPNCTPLRTHTLLRTQSTPEPEHTCPPSSSHTPTKPKAKSVSSLSTPPSPILPLTSPRKGRITKKALALAEQERREEYAQELFDELNKIVFDDGLPKGTKLTWNKRLQTTAGRAQWHRSSDGKEESGIELATKVLDCEERIRNTLSHEMCHLACWTINGNPKEGHGQIWKSWAQKVMRKRPDIVVTTRHAYDIVYKYEWQCKKCSKIYGRHSKSIDPNKCICSVCKEGELVPLFTTAQRATGTPKNKADSRMAAGRTRDSPAPSSVPRNEGTQPSTPSNLNTDDPASKLLQGSKPSNHDNVDALANKLLFIDLTGLDAS